MPRNRPITVKWLTVNQFAAKVGKSPSRIYEWCQEGLVVKMGLVLRKDFTGHWSIGVPVTHPLYAKYAA